MFSENVFYLGSPISVYDNFTDFLKNAFHRVNSFTNCNDFTGAIECFLSDTNTIDVYPIILFVEYPFLNEIGTYISSRLDDTQYILVSFYCEEQVSIGYFGNIFDFVYTVKFNNQLLIDRLANEINNKRNLLFLTCKIKEYYEISKVLSAEKDTGKLLEKIIESSIKLTSSDAATIYLVIDKNSYNWTSIKDNNYEDKLLKFIVSRNMSIAIDLEAHTSAITKESIFGYSVITGKPIRIDDAYKLDSSCEYSHNNYFDLRTGYVTKSILTIPMKNLRGNIIGVIQLINKKNDQSLKIDYKNPDSINNIIPYTYADELIISSLTGYSAVLLESSLSCSNMQNLLNSLKKQNNELDILSKRILRANAEERNRIVRDIHDGPSQSLANILLKLELARKHFENNMLKEGLDELNLVKENIKRTSKEIRTALYDLKPSYLEDGLAKALENRLRVLEENTGLKVNFNFSGDDSNIEQYIAYSLYRMVQETLTNIEKHAKANVVNVDLRVYENGVSIQITDDGLGFDINTQADKHKTINGGFGLSGLKERVELLKGRFDIQSTPGNGTSLIIYIPL